MIILFTTSCRGECTPLMARAFGKKVSDGSAFCLLPSAFRLLVGFDTFERDRTCKIAQKRTPVYDLLHSGHRVGANERRRSCHDFSVSG